MITPKAVATIALLTSSLVVCTQVSASTQAVASTDSDASSAALEGDVQFSACSIGSAGVQLAAQCATVQVPLDPDDPALGMQTLSIARIESRRRSGNTDALTLVAGGPGQSAIETFPAYAFAFRHIMRDRDLILIDQRGTGSSTPLNCPELDGSTGINDGGTNNGGTNTGGINNGSIESGLNTETDPEEIERLSAICLDALDVDPRLFTTSIAVQDLENVRQQLGISQWNIYGVSYGTRVAIHYLRRFPDAVRTLILDAVVPPQISLGPEIVEFAQQSLEHIFNRCASDPGCYEAFGELMQPTLALMDELSLQPRTITYEDITTGQLTTREFTREQLAVTLRLLSYTSQTAAILPSMLFDAIENDNLAPFARQYDIQNAAVGKTLSSGMHHAVICTEDNPFFDSETMDSEARETEAPTYLGQAVMDSTLATCKPWPMGRIDDDFKQPLTSSKPTLVLSGGADPITPPVYGDLVTSTLENAEHIINDAQGHMQAAFGCMPVLMAQFVNSADAKTLNRDCLQRLRATPFFIDANGPLP